MRLFLVLLLVFSLSSIVTAQQNSNDFKKLVDPRIELMGVVQLLTDYPLVSKYDSQYKKDVRAYFTDFKNHDAARLFEEMDGEGFAFDAVPKAMLSLTEPPELSQRKPFTKSLESRASGADSLAKFVEALRDFAQKSKFMTFYEAHKGTYSTVLERTENADKAIETLKKYSGYPLKNSTVILGPLLHDGGFSASFDKGNGIEAYALIGPTGIEEGVATFGSAQRLASLTWHEFSHTFVNELTEKYLDKINTFNVLYEPIKNDMQEAGYGNWKTVVDEHIIRAIEVRLTYQKFGKKSGDKELGEQKDRGFKYVEMLANELKTYEKNRDKYPTIADFYSNLINVFKKEASKMN